MYVGVTSYEYSQKTLAQKFSGIHANSIAKLLWIE